MALSRFSPACRRTLLALGITAWSGVVGGGLWALETYANTAGPAALSPDEWPTAATDLHRDTGRPTLIMFLHPRCACSHASVQELSRLMARAAGLVTARVVFYRPADAEPDWEQADLWRLAAAIPGVTVTSDADAQMADAFGAQVSGQSMLYAADGHLLFSGGVTASRGHEGDNDGVDAIVALVRGGTASAARTSVFGCLLHGDRSASAVAKAPRS